MAEYRYYLIPDAMTRAFPEKFEKQTPTEFFDNIADLEKRYHQLREMPYNNERTWNERARFPYVRLVVGVDRQNPDGAVAIIQVRNGVNGIYDYDPHLECCHLCRWPPAAVRRGNAGHQPEGPQRSRYQQWCMGNGRRCADYCGCHLLRHADSRVKEGCAIFEDTIRSQLEGISATVNSMGQNSGLLSSLTDWNSTLAGYADSISTGVVMPVALTLLALFMILELYNATQRIAMNGSNNAFTIQQIALVMLKIVVCRWAVVHTTEILNALFEIASTVTTGISGYVGSGEVNTTVDIENAIAALPGGIGNMPVALELMVVGWMLRIVNIVVNTIVAARFIELYVYNAMASLSIATLCYQELHGIAVNFLKSYLAVALQGAVLYLVIGFYPALAGSLGTGGSITEQAWAMLGQSVILLVAVFMSGKFTKAITNAMT